MQASCLIIGIVVLGEELIKLDNEASGCVATSWVEPSGDKGAQKVHQSLFSLLGSMSVFTNELQDLKTIRFLKVLLDNRLSQCSLDDALEHGVEE